MGQPDGPGHPSALDAGDEGLRLFVAVDVPGPQKASVEAAIAPLKAVVPGARWTSPSIWHVTLRFIGEIAADRLPAIREGVERALSGAGPLDSHLLDIGAFPTMSRARVLWAGIEDPRSTLAGWAERIGRECGLKEDRPLHPHLTLARLKVPAAIGPVVDRFRPFDLDRTPYPIDKVTLFRSYTERSGPRYEPLKVWSLSTG